MMIAYLLLCTVELNRFLELQRSLDNFKSIGRSSSGIDIEFSPMVISGRRIVHRSKFRWNVSRKCIIVLIRVLVFRNYIFKWRVENGEG